MRRARSILAIGAACLLAAGGAAAQTGRGTVAVALAPAAPPADRPFADAVGQALGEADFTLLPEHSRYVAIVGVARQRSGTTETRVRKERVVASPLAVSVPLPSRKTRLVDLVTTTLTVRLTARDGGKTVWTGSALSVAAEDAPVALKLARAAVAAYPQTQPSPVTVP